MEGGWGAEKCDEPFRKVVIFRLWAPAGGHVAAAVGFHPTANLHIISNLHSVGHVINCAAKMIHWMVSKHGASIWHFVGFCEAFWHKWSALLILTDDLRGWNGNNKGRITPLDLDFTDRINFFYFFFTHCNKIASPFATEGTKCIYFVKLQ